MEGENSRLVNRVLKEYFEKRMSQKEIAYTEHISKSTVSRILSRAREEGLVQIELKLECPSSEKLEQTLRETFLLEEVHVCPEVLPDLQSRLQDVVRALAKDLPAILQNNDILALGGGRTVGMLADMLPPSGRLPGGIPAGIRIVQACGMLTGGRDSFHVCGRMYELAEKLHAVPQLLPAPAFLKDGAAAAALRKDPQIAEIMSLAEEAEICIFTAGVMENKTALLRNRSFGYEQFGRLADGGAVGDVLLHFLDREGKPADPELDARTMSLPLENLKKKKRRILVAAGEQRAESMRSALRAGIPNTLYTDERTARRLLEIS